MTGFEGQLLAVHVPHRQLQLHYNQISAKIKAGEKRPYSSSGLLSLSTLAMLHKVHGLSAWCRLYPVLSPSSCFCLVCLLLDTEGVCFLSAPCGGRAACCFIHFGSHSDVLFALVFTCYWGQKVQTFETMSDEFVTLSPIFLHSWLINWATRCKAVMKWDLVQACRDKRLHHRRDNWKYSLGL